MNKGGGVRRNQTDLEICFDLGKRITPEAWPWDSVTEFYSWMLEDFVGFDFDELRAKDAYQAPYEYHKYEKGLCRSDGKPGFETVTGLVELKSLQFGGLGRRPAAVLHRAAVQPARTPDTYKEYPLVLSTGGRKFTFVPFRASARSSRCAHRPVAHRGNTPRDRGEVRHRGRRMGGDREPVRALPRKGPRHPHGRPARRPCAARVVVPRAGRARAPNYFGVFKAQINNLMPHEHIGKLGLGAPYKCLLCKIRPVSGLED